MIAPIRFKPRLVEKIWGGRRLETLMGKALPSAGRYGESWEVSAHPGDETPAEYPLDAAGRTIPDIASSAQARDVFGRHAEDVREKGFPLLYKFIDAAEVLSVQVHPDDAYARAYEGDNGKTEAWVILWAGPGSRIYKGFLPGTDIGVFDSLLAENRLDECLNSFEVYPGDVVFLPSKTVHAIGGGILLAEIQQSSDVTYRVYDWGRTGADGKPRQLHVDRAREVMDLGPPAENTASAAPLESLERGSLERLVSCDSFVLERAVFDPGGAGAPHAAGGGRFCILSVAAGSARLEWPGGGMDIKTGESFLVPAALDAPAVACAERTVLLYAYLP
ncbi:MAG: class I mannose-6-phosphate isomerase [Planctomycetes bacterium]|nr:class I mannose-6-phosphate isomerase [Planctomycetota bacterium]